MLRQANIVALPFHDQAQETIFDFEVFKPLGMLFSLCVSHTHSRNHSIVLLRPSSRPTLGSQLSTCLALPISGRRT